MKKLMKDFYHLEEIQFCNVRARKAAHELSEEIVSAGSQHLPKEASCRNLTIGTDCCGIDAPAQALRNFPGVNFQHLFCCDNDESVLESIKGNF